jgi:pimeloyl-ACP methyl ester carboxylesterase
MPPDRHTLLFHPSALSPHPVDLPSHIIRHYVPTALGNLELLSAQPSPSQSPRKKALLFQHGGFGHASVFLPFLTFFSERGHPSYALSLRGHGASWRPSFFQLVWQYGKNTMAQDLRSAVEFVMSLEREKRGGEIGNADLVLVGHSAGGGLVQYFLSQEMERVGGLVVVAGFPNFGG